MPQDRHRRHCRHRCDDAARIRRRRSAEADRRASILPPPDGPTRPTRWPGARCRSRFVEHACGRRDSRSGRRSNTTLARPHQRLRLRDDRAGRAGQQVASASESRAMCCVTSTSATARSRVACRTKSEGARPARRRRSSRRAATARSPRPAGRRSARRVTTACSRRSFSRYAGCAAARTSRARAWRRSGGARAEAAEGAHERHVADHVDHLAVDGRRLVGEIVMQRLAGGGEAEHRDDDDTGDRGERSAIGRLMVGTKAMAPTVARKAAARSTRTCSRR